MLPEEAKVDVAVDLYELSKVPQFEAMLDLLSRIANDYRADFPRTVDEQVAYDTSNAVANTVRVIIQKLGEEIAVGKRLSVQDVGGESNADESGYKRRRA